MGGMTEMDNPDVSVDFLPRRSEKSEYSIIAQITGAHFYQYAMNKLPIWCWIMTAFSVKWRQGIF